MKELYECAAFFVDVHHTEREERIHSTAAGGPVHCGKSEDVCLHVEPPSKIDRNMYFLIAYYALHVILWSHCSIILYIVYTLYIVSFQLQFVYLQKAHIPKLTRGKEAQETEVLRVVLAKLVAHYKEPAFWGTPPADPFTWYWEILDRTCQLVKPPIKGSFDLSWCHEGQMVVSLLAQVYSTFSEAFSVTSLQYVPNAVSQCGNGHMRRYFEWVQEIQEFIRAWQQRIIDADWTEEEIKQYANMANQLDKMAQSLHIEALQVSIEEVASLKTEIQNLKPFVKNTLIRIDNDGRR